MRATRSTQKARQLGAGQTDAERRLWLQLRDRRFLGLKFRRQVPVGCYIVDFACIEKALAIELDGGQHGLTVDEDRRRTHWLEQQGWRVLRFWNNDVLQNIDGVLENIAIALEASPHPVPTPQAGEGELMEVA